MASGSRCDLGTVSIAVERGVIHAQDGCKERARKTPGRACTPAAIWEYVTYTQTTGNASTPVCMEMTCDVPKEEIMNAKISPERH